MVCGKCNSDFVNPKEVVKCTECALEFHVTCCRIRTAAKLARMSNKLLATWRCDECAQESASAASRSDTDDPTILELLKSIRREVADSKQTNKENFASLEKTMVSVQDSIIELKTKLASIEVENINLKRECATLRRDNQSLKDEVNDLKRDVIELQQYSRVQNVEIRGVPVTANEDVYCVLEAVAKVIAVPYSRHDISTAHRLPAPRNRRYHPSIVVQFVSRTTRNMWIAAAKNKKPSTSDLTASFAPGPIFIGDHLTQHNKNLLSWAKSYVRSGRLAYAWSKDGKLFVRQTTASSAVRVWTQEDVSKALAAPTANQLEPAPSPR